MTRDRHRLGRDVALKLLPQAFASDPDRLARFEREAKVLASLSHPNIATLFGLEEIGPGMVRFSFEARDAVRPGVVLSPDGRLVAFNQAYSSQNGILIRPLASLETRLLPGTNRPGGSFFST